MKNIAEIAKKIGIPVKRWEGKCHEISALFLKHKIVTGELRYGHFLGKVSKKSIFGSRLIIQHGWVEKKGGTVVDPTRWTLEAVKPYIFVGTGNGEYDIGGNRFRMENIGLPPEPQGAITTLMLGKKVKVKVCTLLNLNADARSHKLPLALSQVFFLSNLAPEVLQPHAVEIYQALARAKHQALIPLDNWQWIMK